MKPHYDTVFLDRDGTINPDPGYIGSLEQFELYPFTFDALSLLAENGYRFCIITNQSGIGRGLIQQKKLDEIHTFIKREFEKKGLPLLGIYVCPDHPDHASERRKPDSGMFLEAAHEHDINLENCLMIGDTPGDIFAGQQLDMDTMLVLTGKGVEAKELLKNNPPTFIVDTLLDGANQLVSMS
ncbi:MAG: HAD family hydrolase [Candidatus Marinimicrobia bacterium]|nr:HAD family hydrolase [Candidatus Neomarinimicrobiota bacterium]